MTAALARAGLVQIASDYARAARAANTERAYASDWRTFSAWCSAHGLDPRPAAPATVALYAAHLAQLGRSAATIGRAIVAISQAHKSAGLESPTADEAVRKVLAGIRKTHGVRQDKKAPMLRADLVLACADASPRDRALLLLGFAGGFRRSELAALEDRDLERLPSGYVVRLRRSKTNQEGRDERKFISEGRDPALCPVRALDTWVESGRGKRRELALVGGPETPHLVFGCCTKTIARVLKRAAARAGRDPTRYSGHSLRRGCITEAHLAGVADVDTMRHVGIKSREVFDGYVDDADLIARAVKVL